MGNVIQSLLQILCTNSKGKRLSGPNARSGDGEADGEDKEGGGIRIC